MTGWKDWLREQFLFRKSSGSIDLFETRSLLPGDEGDVAERFAWILGRGAVEISWTEETKWRDWNGRVHEPDMDLFVPKLIVKLGQAYRDALNEIREQIILDATRFWKDKASLGALTKEDEENEAAARKVALAEEFKPYWSPQILMSKKLQTQTGRNAMLALLQVQSAIQETEFDADTDPLVLVVKNGVLDLEGWVAGRGAGLPELKPHRPSRRVTFGIQVDWEPLALCARWEAFLARSLPVEEDRWHLQKCLGAAILGKHGAARHKFMLNLLGVTNSGKSRVVKVIEELLGGYAIAVEAEALQSARTSKEENARHAMRGRRFVLASETESNAGGKYDAGFLKKYTSGGDTVSTRSLYSRANTNWVPQGLIMVGSNDPMRFDVADRALVMRIRPVPFDIEFSADPGTPPERAQWPELADELRAEYPGILVWLMRGAWGFLREGLAEPESVTKARMKMLDEMDSAYQWVSECLKDDRLRVCLGGGKTAAGWTWDPAQALGVRQAHKAYVHWFTEGKVGTERTVIGERTFARRLESRWGKHEIARAVVFPGLALGSAWTDEPVLGSWATGL